MDCSFILFGLKLNAYYENTIYCCASLQFRKLFKQCLDSLVIGGDEVEVIIVNDGSTDNTEEIAKEYCQKYPNIVRLENKPNGGHGSAINRGLSVAKGLYFKVVDSDDWFEEGAYRKLIKLLKKQVSKPKPIDLVLANYVYEYSYNKHSSHDKLS